jgi:hypothetical protein
MAQHPGVALNFKMPLRVGEDYAVLLIRQRQLSGAESDFQVSPLCFFCRDLLGADFLDDRGERLLALRC